MDCQAFLETNFEKNYLMTMMIVLAAAPQKFQLF